ncbi:hypothetical protein CLV85_0307 [Salinibacterium amurskyense]|uniref:UvrD-like helicase ATP-binding domain-containing protein n=1 Tax=Salinibacterium amurskyense TaxID=205941 RepID=A0A2M9D605_9MICO|nr:hypothetical protein [Salinibacterium amurskyense]PJJ81137.1 hypothetical protein CLV85_0307 [Salinibacterium amurskyense]RLQ83161.1 hypothetical protein D9C83_01530 [Salinibacterium amurskyense]GHD81503.1 hypothetical protein GCM10007394_15000 [Salinibacterium amurskyense]
MKPLITTVKAISELASGLSPEAISSSPVLFLHSGSDVDVLLSAEDTIDQQRVILLRAQHVQESFVPDQLSSLRREVLGRVASFAERARAAGILSLPRGWHQYKHNTLISFFAVPGGDSKASRWVAEVNGGVRHDVIFWALTTSSEKEALQEFDRARSLPAIDFDAAWSSGFAAAMSYFQAGRDEPKADVEMSLPRLASGSTKGWTYDQWLREISNDQRLFVEAPTEKSIRLRGPAGSGKTLALTLKALRGVIAAREAGEEIRVLIVTHSWSLATEVADSLTAMGMGLVPEIDVFPLLEIAQSISPQYVRDDTGFSLIGTDSLSGKQAQLLEISDLLSEFVEGDWVTFRAGVSSEFAARFDAHGPDERLALAWDLLIEFGSVIGAAAIFPGAGAESKYAQLSRASWMMPMKTRQDLRVVFQLYSRYMASLDARSLLTSDQVLADLLNHLETHAWNRARKFQGYDLIFVDEFHLFSPLERQVLHYLSRDVTKYPSVFMAVDPRQSPSEAFIGLASDDTHSGPAIHDDELGEIDNFELTTVHRFTPQILDLIKHVHHLFPTLDLGQPWDINFSAVKSAQSDGPIPKLVLAASQEGELLDINSAVQELYAGGRMALAVVDPRQWGRFSRLAAQIGTSGKFHVSTISGRSDVEGLGYRKKGLVVGPAEYLAGLQFETVLVAGIPDLQSTATINDRTRFLSLLYLAISRAEHTVRLFVNDEDGAVPELLQQALASKVVSFTRGSLT